MPRSNNLLAAFDAADQRVHEAREAVKAAIRERAEVQEAINQARVPEELRAYGERIRKAYELTAEEQAERNAARERLDAVEARRAEIIDQLARVEAGEDPPLNASVGWSLTKMAEAVKRAKGREARIKAAKESLTEELRELNGSSERPGPFQRARRDLNAAIRRTDAARKARRQAVKAEFARAHRPRPEERNVYPSRISEAVFTGRTIKDGKEHH